MSNYNDNEIIKPDDWPINYKEKKLSILYDTLNKFIDKPNYKTKEVLISLCVQGDLNEFDNRGFIRITKYEIGIINTLFF
ncbi:MAG: hypothetical protein ACOCQD_03280 [archaeon]